MIILYRLSDLYNQLNSASKLRYIVFQSIVTYASENNLLSLVTPYLNQMKKAAEDWSLSKTELRELHLVCSRALGRNEEYRFYLFIYLSCFFSVKKWT